MTEDILVGLDIGSSLVRCLLAVNEEGSTPRVIGWGVAPSDGVRNGVIINIRSAANAISQAITELENRGYEVQYVTAGITGTSIDGMNSRGVVAINKGKEIGDFEIDRVMDAAKAVVIPEDREILHIIPQEYMVDGTPDIADPRGMMGVRLEVETHIITVSLTAIRNLINAVNTAGIKVEELLFGGLAAAEACLTQDEKFYGCVHLHMGAGTTDVTLWYKGAPRFTRSYPLGGNMVTADLSSVLHISITDAERLKKEEGACYPGLLENDQVLIQRVGDSRVTPIQHNDLLEIIGARVIETLEIIKNDLIKSGFMDRINGGVVLTGGAALLLGMPELAQKLFHRHSRLAVPMGLGSLRDPINGTDWSVCAGLVQAAARTHAKIGPRVQQRSSDKGLMNWIKNIFKKII